MATKDNAVAVKKPGEARGDLRADLIQTLEPERIEVLGPVPEAFTGILTPEALGFVAMLARRFTPVRDELLSKRVERQAAIDAGQMPDFLPETKKIRESAWTVVPIPTDLEDRRTEITGPVDRKMIINGLNSGASVFMADFEDASTPTWANTIEGQVNLMEAVRGTITFRDPASGEELKKIVDRLFALPPAVANRLKETLK